MMKRIARRLVVRAKHEHAFFAERCALCAGRFARGARIVVVTSVHGFGGVRHAATHWPTCPIADLLAGVR